MILITGGTGFIGSVLQAAFFATGEETVVTDWLGHDGKWKNLAAHPPLKVIPPEELPAFLQKDPPLKAVIHMGAISATTATDGDLTWKTNVTLSQYLWEFCTEKQISFIYASSAATYGAGEQGFLDDDRPEYLASLRPLNLYGWTKNCFDLFVSREIRRGKKRPPQYAGLKFFNVYGPNEYHKGSMISVVKVKYDEITAGKPVTLFKSYRADIPDGEQKRDFLWVGDIALLCRNLLEKSHISGLFNVGTGVAESYNRLAENVCLAAGVPVNIRYIEMPDNLKNQYQYFTKADISKLREAGYNELFTSLKDGINQYVCNRLLKREPYL